MERTSGFRNIRRVCGRLIVIGAMASTLAVAASATAERTLAGVKIFAPMSLVLKKYGTPTEVRIGAQSTSTQSGTSNGPFGAGGGPGGPGGPGGLPGFGGGGPGGGYPGAGAGGGYPGAGGRGPGGPEGPYGGRNGAGGGYGADGESTTLGVAIQPNMVTWIYDLPDGGSLEFTFSSDGRVIQIHATGLKGNERTAKGVALGMKLSQVMQMYGFPERQFISNRILHTSYIDKDHIAFQFYHQKLVGIIVAAVD